MAGGRVGSGSRDWVAMTVSTVYTITHTKWIGHIVHDTLTDEAGVRGGVRGGGEGWGEGWGER